jgi:hypothetical protein
MAGNLTITQYVIPFCNQDEIWRKKWVHFEDMNNGQIVAESKKKILWKNGSFGTSRMDFLK